MPTNKNIVSFPYYPADTKPTKASPLIMTDGERLIRGWYIAPQSEDYTEMGGFTEFGTRLHPHVKFWAYERDVLDQFEGSE